MTATAQISALSRQYIQVPVTEVVSWLPADPTSNLVYMAFKLGRNPPADVDWVAGSWQTSSVNGQYFAQCLIGPGTGTVLTQGEWAVWLKITADPEQPIIQTGTIAIY